MECALFPTGLDAHARSSKDESLVRSPGTVWWAVPDINHGDDGKKDLCQHINTVIVRALAWRHEHLAQSPAVPRYSLTLSSVSLGIIYQLCLQCRIRDSKVVLVGCVSWRMMSRCKVVPALRFSSGVMTNSVGSLVVIPLFDCSETE